MAFAVSRGEANVYLVLVIPVIVGTGPLALLGVFLVFAGFLLTFLLWPSRLVAEPGDRGVSPVSPEGAPPARRWGASRSSGRFRPPSASLPRLPAWLSSRASAPSLPPASLTASPLWPGFLFP